MTLRTSLTPLGGGRIRTGTAKRGYALGRCLPVTGTTIVLRDYASAYMADLSAAEGGTKTFTLDESKTHPANHEAAAFVLFIAMPGTDPPKIELPFVDRWFDFGRIYRPWPGKIQAINCVKIGGKWLGSACGVFYQPTKRSILSRIEETGAAITLKDRATTYRAEVSGPTAFTIDTSGLKTEKKILRFGLIIDVKNELALGDISLPADKWFDFCRPYRPWTIGKHHITFITLDGGDTWLGRYDNKL